MPSILRLYRVIPLEEDDSSIKIMVPNDISPEVLEEVRFFTGKDLRLIKIDPQEFSKILQERLAQEAIVVEGQEEEGSEPADILYEDESSPAVAFVNQTLIKATSVGASDIHIEPNQSGVNVRFRLDGVLNEYTTIPHSLHEQVVLRIKVLANLNVAEKRVPQDGKISIKVGQRNFDVRTSVVPSVFGERVVLRLLERGAKLLELQDLGLSPQDLQKLKRLSQKPYGMIIATGPTGSGKSTTLYAMILNIKSPSKNIITIEDPPEYQIDGVSQVQVNPKVGLTFASGLRALLRQDPDVIMVGEIRDSETAQIATQAALTGHLVLSTLHTNDAPSAITRLFDLGIEPFLIASSLEGVLAQRLVRRICDNCKVEYTPSDEELAQLGLSGGKFYRGQGCEKCLYSGYRGRTAIFEVLELNEEIKRLIVRTQDSNEISEFLKAQGFSNMLQDGIRKVLQGITTAEEVLRAVKSQQ
ncbi:MAG: GspE/PulE family protein [Aquificaceae bacterium]